MAAIALFVVGIAPAVAGAGDPSAAGVPPTETNLGGQPNDCTAVESAATYELRIENPQDGQAHTGPNGAVFTLTVDSDDQHLDYVLSGPGVVFDVVVKGGQKSTHFDYEATAVPGPVTSDQDLHAPSKGNDPDNLFNISHVSFCYEEAFAVSGVVFLDSNQDRVQNPGEGPDVARSITAYRDGSPVASTLSDPDNGGLYTLFVQIGGTYTICEDQIADHAQTAPDNQVCDALGTSEAGGYDGITDTSTMNDFGNAAEICGQDLQAGVVISGDFELFDVGNEESNCDDKAGVLFESVVDGVEQLNLPLVGSGSVAGIGVITKDFGIGSTSYVPLRYSQTGDPGTFVELPWCGLKDKGGPDGDQFDPYLEATPGAGTDQYPSLNGIYDDAAMTIPSVSCKVYVDENANGKQTTVTLVQDDPYWQ